jgi:hypothetical protein
MQCDTYAFAKPVGPGKSLHADWSVEKASYSNLTTSISRSGLRLRHATEALSPLNTELAFPRKIHSLRMRETLL